MPYPPFSISETTTYPATFEEDLAAYKAAGVEGIGIWEFKLPKGQDERSIEALQASGLEATICVPEVPCILPDAYFREPRDPIARRKALCAAIRRFAAFKPAGVMVLSGAPSGNPATDRRVIVEGLKAAADAAGEAGVELGFEAIRKDAGSIISTLPETLGIIEDIGAPNIRVIFDAWHFWDLPNIVNDLRKVRRPVHLHPGQRPAPSAQLGRPAASRRRRLRPPGFFRRAGRRRLQGLVRSRSLLR